ncbi:hypothetical protein WR25_21975 [Diploscapter pachys]|uniref:Growth factor receptor domain-containing protein n=1 Tax=Diploscapter pachys TaxID=2018661 RepID=A0A2A2L9G0_9BILA|nr:hypothetical protein WR25_21975 [Diploscapter pachys]
MLLLASGSVTCCPPAFAIRLEPSPIPLSRTDHTEPISFGDLTSAGNCHAECDGGCTESQSATTCFKCKHLTQTLRNKAGNGFKCVSHCDDTYYLEDDKCKMCSKNCHTCSQAELCETCPGSQLLVDFEHPHKFDHGKCVDKCPEGLIPDYETNLLQAKCILREDKCGPGYFINTVGKCSNCDNACETCAGPGPMSCIQCAKGYGNRSVGYCRPCCVTGEAQMGTMNVSCEDCSPNAHYPDRSRPHSSFFFSFAWVLVVATVFLLFGCLFYYCTKEETSGAVYTPLPHYNSETDRVHLMEASDSDEEDRIYDKDIMLRDL